MSEIQRQAIANYHATTTRRARERIVALVRSGHHVGPVPYGYQAVRDHPAPAQARAAAGTLLQPNPRTAPVIPVIFSWFVDGHLSFPQIVNRLNADPEHFPPPTDPVTGRHRRWTVHTIRAIVANPTYTGRTVWGRTRRGRPLPREQWITSGPEAHPALIDDTTFAHATFSRRHPN